MRPAKITAYVMTPVFTDAYRAGIEPLAAEQIEFSEAFERASQPFHGFMMSPFANG